MERLSSEMLILDRMHSGALEEIEGTEETLRELCPGLRGPAVVAWMHREGELYGAMIGRGPSTLMGAVAATRFAVSADSFSVMFKDTVPMDPDRFLGPKGTKELREMAVRLEGTPNRWLREVLVLVGWAGFGRWEQVVLLQEPDGSWEVAPDNGRGVQLANCSDWRRMATYIANCEGEAAEAVARAAGLPPAPRVPPEGEHLIAAWEATAMTSVAQRANFWGWGLRAVPGSARHQTLKKLVPGNLVDVREV